MPAATTDKFKKVGESTVTTLASPGKAVGASSINVGSTTNFPSTTGIIIAIRTVDSNGELVAGTYTEFSATVSSGTSFAIETSPVYGNDQIYAAGSSTQVYIPVSAQAHNTMVDGLLIAHEQDGTHKSAAVYLAPTIADFTNAAHDHGDADDGGAIVLGAIPDGLITGAKFGKVEGASTYKTAAAGINNGSWTVIDMDAELWDTNTLHSTSSNTSRITIAVAGLYHIIGRIGWDSNATGIRGTQIYKNGASLTPSVMGLVGAGAVNGNVSVVSCFLNLAVSDYVEVAGYQSSGGSLNTAANQAALEAILVGTIS